MDTTNVLLLRSASVIMQTRELVMIIDDHKSIGFRADVRIVGRMGHFVLFRSSDAKAARVPRSAYPLLALLKEGTQLAELQQVLQACYPTEGAIAPKLEKFLCRLEHAGLLNSSVREVQQPTWHRWTLFDLDPLACRCVRILGAMPRFLLKVLFVILTISSLVGVAIFISAMPKPGLQLLLHGAWGIFFFLFLVLPARELAHAIACRAVGAPVLGAGFVFHGGIIPGPFVDTSSTYAVASRWLRFFVPIVGPLVDLWAAGVAAWILQLGLLGERLQSALASFILLSTIFLLLDMNPLLQTDGSRALEAILDDELARRAAFARSGKTLSSKSVLWLYRLACFLYACVVAFLVMLLCINSR